MTQQIDLDALQAEAELTIFQNTQHEITPGWYWVRFESSDGSHTEPQPARWNGRHWYSEGYIGIPLYGAILLEACQPPGTDPLQGAADWFVEACQEPDVALIQNVLMLGYNRASRLFYNAMKRSKRHNSAAPSDSVEGAKG